MTRPSRPPRPTPVRQEIQRLQATRGTSAPAMIRRVRAQAAADQFASRPNAGEPMPVSSRRGQVTFARVEFREIDSSTSFVDVWVGDSGDGPPHYRIFNPPTLAEDSEGEVEIEGQRYREDPMAAIAEVIIGGNR